MLVFPTQVCIPCVFFFFLNGIFFFFFILTIMKGTLKKVCLKMVPSQAAMPTPVSHIPEWFVVRSLSLRHQRLKQAQ